MQDHSLARDIGELRKLAQEQIKPILKRNITTDETSFEMTPVNLIPTEQLESAAARVRPVFLKSDKVHYDAVTTVP